MIDTELKQMEKKIESELEPFIKGIYQMNAQTKTFQSFKKAYVDFTKMEESGRVIRRYIMKGLLKKTHEVKDIIHLIFQYLGLVESIGNSIANLVTMLLVANGSDFHIECRHTTPRIKHAVSIRDLEEERVPLTTKLHFLRDNNIVELASVIDSTLRNDIAHLNFDIRKDGIFIRDKAAKELLLDSTIKLLRACNFTMTLLDELAMDRIFIQKRSKTS